MKTKINTVSYLFGSVYEFNGVRYIFSHHFGDWYMLMTMDGKDFELIAPEKLTWLYQLPVKFYKGLDYVITDDELILTQSGIKYPYLDNNERADLFRRAADSPYHYLRANYNRGWTHFEDYKRTTLECLAQHFINHEADIRLCFI